MRVVYEIPDPPWCCDDYPECWHRVEYDKKLAQSSRILDKKKKLEDERKKNTECICKRSTEL